MEIFCTTCDKVLGHYPDAKIPLNVWGHTNCKHCGTRIDIFRTAKGPASTKFVKKGKAGKFSLLNLFRVLSVIEGLSLIALMCVAIPAKYYFKWFDVVWDVGMIHGILWMIYFVMSLAVSHVEKWKVTLWILAVFASVIPFACFLLEKKLKSVSNAA